MVFVFRLLSYLHHFNVKYLNGTFHIWEAWKDHADDSSKSTNEVRNDQKDAFKRQKEGKQWKEGKEGKEGKETLKLLRGEETHFPAEIKNCTPSPTNDILLVSVSKFFLLSEASRKRMGTTVCKTCAIFATMGCVFVESFGVYFTNIVNLFCLMISLGQIAEYGDYRSLVPLLLMATLNGCWQVWTCSKLLSRQQSINETAIERRDHPEQDTLRSTLRSTSRSTLRDAFIRQGSIARGERMTLFPGMVAPADFLLTHCQTPICVNELQLTGENVAVQKDALFVSDCVIQEIELQHRQDTGWAILKPNRETWANDKVDGSKRISFDPKNIVFRGTKIISGEAEGWALEIGSDCKMFRTCSKKSSRPTAVQNQIVKLCCLNVVAMLTLAGLCGFALYYKVEFVRNGGKSYRKLARSVFRMVLLLNTLVPLSMDFFLTSVSTVLSERMRRKLGIRINPHGNCVFQTCPTSIITDKTGTLTQNKVKLSSVWCYYYANENCRDSEASFVAFNADKEGTIQAERNDQTQMNAESVFLATSALTSEQPFHSTADGGDTCSDPLEHCLLRSFSNFSGMALIENSNSTSASSNYFKCERKSKSKRKSKDDEKTVKRNRLYQQPFDARHGYKWTVTDDFILHIQGTPESICSFQKGGTEIPNQLQKVKAPDNTCLRIIAYASQSLGFLRKEKNINWRELTKDGIPKEWVQDIARVHVYFFLEELVVGIKDAFHQLSDFPITILTGDSLSTAMTVAMHTGMSPIVLDGHAQARSAKYGTWVISGNEIEKLLACENWAIKNKIVYRCSPQQKQRYVEMVKMHSKVVMIGDGTNDIGALCAADCGIAIGGENFRLKNPEVQDAAHVVVQSWREVPAFLSLCRAKTYLFATVAQWVFSKHVMTAFCLFWLFLFSKYEVTKDPASPFLMMFFNVILFLAMIWHTWISDCDADYTDLTDQVDHPYHVGATETRNDAKGEMETETKRKTKRETSLAPHSASSLQKPRKSLLSPVHILEYLKTAGGGMAWDCVITFFSFQFASSENSIHYILLSQVVTLCLILWQKESGYYRVIHFFLILLWIGILLLFSMFPKKIHH